MPMSRAVTAFMTMFMLSACAAEPPPGVDRSLPGDGGVAAAPLTSVRVWFNEHTDLARSEIALEGPEGGIPLVGTHSMGEGDLMASVGLRTPAGDYALTWTAAGAGGATATGVINFTVEAGESEPAP